MRIRGLTPPTFARAMRVDLRLLPKPRHVFLAVADHFEPEWRDANRQLADERIQVWRERFPDFAKQFADSRGRPYQHTFFYPAEVGEPRYLELLAQIKRLGVGDVEVHLHHGEGASLPSGERVPIESADCLRDFLTEYVGWLHREFGLLDRDRAGQVRYGFVHGNWALNNCRADGRFCGIKGELEALRASGCYADFTMPSAPDHTQTKTINRIYDVNTLDSAPGSHDRPFSWQLADKPECRALRMIPGPLAISFRLDGWRIRPRLENGNLATGQAPAIRRFKVWLRSAVSVPNRSDWTFIKLHTHGAQEGNREVLLGETMRQFHDDLREEAQRSDFRYYYVTTREMALLSRQAEAGLLDPDFDALHW